MMHLKWLLVNTILLLGSVLGYVANNPTIYLENSQLSLQLPDIDNNFQPIGDVLKIQSINEVFNLKFSMPNSEQLPQQVSLLLGYPELSVEIAFLPDVKKSEDATTYHFTIRFDALPQPLLKIADSKDIAASVSLIIAGEGTHDHNLFVKLVDFSLKGLPLGDWSEPVRLGPLDNITHVFRAPPKTVSKYYALTFCLLVGFCSISLLVLWASYFSKMMALPHGGFAIPFLLFLSCIIAIEVVFTKYYLGATIFRTIYVMGPLAIVTFYAGRHTLRYVFERSSTKKVKQN